MLTDTAGRHFELLTLLGQGAFGEVWLARMASSGGLSQTVAVKLLRPGLDPRSQAVERLHDEARLLASLRHPVILAAHDLVELGGRVALVTEFIEGWDLSDCLGIGPDPIPPSTLLEVVEQVASALDLAWRQLQVVHRDVKPANIRIGIHGNVKLLDFGIARSAIDDRAAHTEAQVVVGTVRFLAPERFDLELPPHPASDVFALGCVLYQGVARAPLFGDFTMPEILQLTHQADAWGALVERRLVPVAPELRGLLRAMLAHGIGDRPTAGVVARRCETLTAQFAGHVPLRRWCRDRPPRSPAAPLSEPAPPSSPSTRWEPDLPPEPATVLADTGSFPIAVPVADTDEAAVALTVLDAGPDAGSDAVPTVLDSDGLVQPVVDPAPAAPRLDRERPFGWYRWAMMTTMISGGMVLTVSVVLLIVGLGVMVGIATGESGGSSVDVPAAPDPTVAP